MLGQCRIAEVGRGSAIIGAPLGGCRGVELLRRKSGVLQPSLEAPRRRVGIELRSVDLRIAATDALQLGEAFLVACGPLFSGLLHARRVSIPSRRRPGIYFGAVSPVVAVPVLEHLLAVLSGPTSLIIAESIGMLLPPALGTGPPLRTLHSLAPDPRRRSTRSISVDLARPIEMVRSPPSIHLADPIPVCFHPPTTGLSMLFGMAFTIPTVLFPLPFPDHVVLVT